MKNLRLAILSITILSATHTAIYAQDEQVLLEEFLRQDAAAVEAVALYPEDIRHAILEAAAYPEVIVKLAGVQEKSSHAFNTLIEAYTQDEQEQIWNLVRFPALVDQLASDGIKSKKQIDALAKPYPKEIHAAALELGRNEHDLLVDISRLNRTTNQAFEQLIAPYPQAAQASFKKLVDLPEILTLLNDELELTLLLGDAYRNNPEQVKERARQLNLEAARKNARAQQTTDATDYQDQPFAADQSAKRLTVIEAAAQIYYQRFSPNSTTDTADQARTDEEIEVTTYYHHPYPYWYGYPRYRRYPYGYGYGYPGFHAALNWYITPNLYTSIHLSPRLYRGRQYGYGHAYRHHHGYSSARAHKRSTPSKARRRQSNRRSH